MGFFGIGVDVFAVLPAFPVFVLSLCQLAGGTATAPTIGRVIHFPKRVVDGQDDTVQRLVFLALVLYFAYAIADIQIDIHRKKKDYEQINHKIEQQQLLRDDLQRSLNNGTDSDYIERIAREKLGYADPDEDVYVDSGGA